MGEVCSMYGQEENYVQSFDEETCSEETFLERLGVGRIIILKCNLKK